VTGLIIGIPAGLLIGRWVWLFVAGSLGVGVDPVVPWLAVLAAAASLLLVATIIAAGAGQRAARASAAVVLRAK
jgi:hypothetical protein